MRLTLAAVPPFRLDLTVWDVGRCEKNIVDQWDGIRYIRTLAYEKDRVKITVTSGGTEGAPQLIITLESNADLTPRIQQDIKFLVGKSHGLAVDLRPFYILAESSEVLAPLVKQFLGIKPPRFPTLFEALVKAIACQQVSLEAAIQILNRFSELVINSRNYSLNLADMDKMTNAEITDYLSYERNHLHNRPFYTSI